MICFLLCRLVLCDNRIPLETFFNDLPTLLKDCSGEPERMDTGVMRSARSKVVVIQSARVPLVKWRFEDRVDVDITFARVSAPHPPSLSQILTPDFLFTVSVETRVNVNGLRTCQEICRLLPLPLEIYATTLRVLKYWAMRRLVYGNLYTYVNGVILAIMLARVCQSVDLTGPKISSPELLSSFFRFYSNALSAYPVAPIYITNNPEPPDLPRVPGMPVCWDYRSAAAQEELLPVVNPSYPYVNAAHCVGRSGMKYFTEEIERGFFLFHSSTGFPLTSLLQPFRYSTVYDRFISVHVLCESCDQNSLLVEDYFQQWKGYLQSKIRIFIYSLECFLDVRPHPVSVDILSHKDAESDVEPPSQRPRLDPTASSSPCSTLHDKTLRTRRLESTFWFAVKAKDTPYSEEELSNFVGLAFDQYNHAWRGGCADDVEGKNFHPSRGNNRSGFGSGFHRFVEIMKDPWWSIHSRDEVSAFLPC